MLLLIGFILPALIGVITRFLKDSDARFFASLIVCALFGVLYNYILHNGVYTGLTMLEIANSIAESVVGMIGTAKVSYEMIWNNHTVGKMIPDKSTDTLLERMKLDGGSQV